MLLNSIKYKYINLLKFTLIDYYRTNYYEHLPVSKKRSLFIFKFLIWLLNLFKPNTYILCEKKFISRIDREEGKDCPVLAESMIGLKRMDNIEKCIFDIIENKVEGDLIETGVWRGGAVIFMKGILEVLDIKDRKVWVADSFEGLPKPKKEEYYWDKDDKHYKIKELQVDLDIVKENFKKYELLDGNVIFLKGWFKDTLPKAKIEKLSLLRLDGDMYESTMDALKYLYPKLSKGGYIIIDDWGAVNGCKQAVLDYRLNNNINEKIINVDGLCIYWQKKKD